MRLTLSLIFILFIQTLPAMGMDSIAEQRAELTRLERQTREKWSALEAWQDDSSWVKKQSQMSLAGTIYAKGWLNPKVSRRIVPDFEKGWLVVDTVSLGPSILETLGTLGSNILLQYYLPYVQAGRINQKSFVNVRAVETYEQALLAKHFKLSEMPLQTDQIEHMEEGEVYSTISSGGFYTRLGGGISNLIGLQLPANLNLGPKSKIKVEDSLKITIAKEDNDHVLVSLERAKDSMKGIGFGFGVFFDDIIDIPVTVGINSTNGYSPITFNYKENHKKTHAAIYRLDLSSEKGQEAYRAFLKKDLTRLDDYAEKEDNGVELDLIKDGDIHSSEWNFALNLIFWRGGWRNIFKEAKYETVDSQGNRFEYMEISGKKVHDEKSGENFERVSSDFSTLIPIKGRGNNEIQIQSTGAFVLESILMFTDTETTGEEIEQLSEDLVQMAPQLRLPLIVREEKDYGTVNVDVRIRFTPMAISSILNATEDETWLAVASASGLLDPYIWFREGDRRDFRNEHVDYFHDDNDPPSKEEQLYRKAKRVVSWLEDIRDERENHEKAKLLVKKLKKGERGRLLHKTLLELSGVDEVMIQGSITGKSLY